MKPLKSGCPSSANPSQPPLNRGGACLALPLLRGSWRGFASKRFSGLIYSLLFSCTCIPTANAGTLGRLFFTPEQRTQLDYSYARTATADGGSSPVLTVNGIVQKHGGARTVWVNGVAQSENNSRERSTTTQTVTVPGKSQPIKLKVGEKILLDQTAPANQSTPAE